MPALNRVSISLNPQNLKTKPAPVFVEKIILVLSVEEIKAGLDDFTDVMNFIFWSRCLRRISFKDLRKSTM